ncbi:hypothetical protein ACFQ4K_09015 [Tistrella bauzanensis]
MLPPLLVTLIAHTVLSLSAASVPVLMPTIAGADAAVLIGIFTAVVYATAAATSLCLSHLIPGWGRCAPCNWHCLPVPPACWSARSERRRH